MDCETTLFAKRIILGLPRDGYIVNKEVVRINSKQGLQMMGFPKSFKMPIKEYQRMKQLGNSVAVNVVKEIGNEIISHLKFYGK